MAQQLVRTAYDDYAEMRRQSRVGAEHGPGGGAFAASAGFGGNQLSAGPGNTGVPEIGIAGAAAGGGEALPECGGGPPPRPSAS